MERTKKEPVVKEKPQATNTAANKPAEVVQVTPAQPVDDRIWWRKVGGGSLRLPGRIIKPNEKFLARREDLPKAFMDIIVCLDDEKLKEIDGKEKKKEAPKALYRLKEKKPGLWDVISSVSGKPINEKSLPLSDAEKLKAALEG